MKNRTFHVNTFIDTIRRGAQELHPESSFYLQRWIEKVSDSHSYLQVFLTDLQKHGLEVKDTEYPNIHDKFLDRNWILKILLSIPGVQSHLEILIKSSNMMDSYKMSRFFRHRNMEDKKSSLNRLKTESRVKVSNSIKLELVKNNGDWDVELNGSKFLHTLDEHLARKIILDCNIIYNIRSSRILKNKKV